MPRYLRKGTYWWLPLAACTVALTATLAHAAQDAKAPRKGAAQPTAAAEPADQRAEAERALEIGVQAFDAGKSSDAVKALSKAIQTGGLAPQQMAKALYRRGVAYRKLNQTAPAIADLTSALWLKGGLSETERVDALNNRALAYREAGLSDRADADVRRSEMHPVAAPQVSSWQTQTVRPPAGQPASGSGGFSGFFSNWFGSAKPAATAAKPAPAPTPAPAVAAAPSEPQPALPWQASVSAVSAPGKTP